MAEEALVTAATGALGSVIAKLAALLGSEYKIRRRTRRDVKFIRSKLKPVHSLLWNIWEREQLDEASMALKMEALDLADDVDDAVVDFILSMERCVQTKIKASPFQDFKKRASDVSERCCSKWKERKKKKPADEDSSPGKPRAYPFVRRDASELVGMEEPRDKLIKHLVGEDDEGKPTELQLKTATIYGMAGMGKTTLADQVYEAIGSKFQSRAFVSLTPGGNMREVLQGILQQVAANTSPVPLAGTQAATEEDLIDIISKFLKDKRYLVIVDDIWNWREWEIIMKSLPENNLGCRIVRTTRKKDIADKYGYRDPNKFLHEMLPNWDGVEGWVYKIRRKNIATEIVGMKADLVADGFDYKHPIVRMCGGTPLAVCCMLSAVAQERERKAQQGLHAKACDVQDKIQKHVIEHGIQNTPGFEALVESLQLGYDDLPHHMLKTCLLYCIMYPDGPLFHQQNLVRRWISEGFVCEEEEANGYFDELVNRGFILNVSVGGYPRMHPVMRNFLRWKSREDNFITCSSEITPSYNNSTCRIRRLCIYNSLCRSGDTSVDPLSALDWCRIRSLVVVEGIERVPFEKLERVRVLDLCWITGVQDHHLKDICGLVRLRHLLGLGLDGDGISEIPPEIVRLQCLETFEASGQGFARLAGFIGKLRQLKTLDVIGEAIKVLPREIGALHQLETLRITNTGIRELPKEIWELQQLKTLPTDGSLIEELPKEIGSLQQLKTLDISHTQMTVLPKEVGSLQQLKTLDISHTQITVLPKEVGSLQQLKTLDIKFTQITVLPKEIGSLQQLKTLDISYTKITVLPKEIGGLQQLKTLDISWTEITVLPKEIGSLQQLKTLVISYTKITVLPKEIGELQQLEHLDMTSTKVLKIPREIGALKELKSLKLDYKTAVLPLEVCGAFVEELPGCIHQALKKSDLMCELAREMISFRKSIHVFAKGGLVVGAKQMHVPPWIREHFNDIGVLDITICKLDERGLKILREMPQLRELTLRFQVVPREPVVIGREGFAKLIRLTVDSRVPRVTFQEGAMPWLHEITFRFQFYGGPPNKDPVGINHLRSLRCIYFECNKDWYGGGDSPCIGPTIDVVRKEAQELWHEAQELWHDLPTFEVCGVKEKIHRQRETEQGSSSRTGETDEEDEKEEMSSSAGEIEEDIQA